MGILSTLRTAQLGLAQVYLSLRRMRTGEWCAASHAPAGKLGLIQLYFTFTLPGLMPGRPCPALYSAHGHVTF